MSTIQIPRERWEEFLSSFSAKYQTRNVTLDFESNELGPQRLVDRKPLIALEPDIKDDKTIITVIVGDPEGGEPTALAHEVGKAIALWVKESEEGQMEALDIETEDGRTILQLV